MEELIKEIFLIEWDMFRNVSNEGGQALCQQNLKTFAIMRMSQFMCFTEPMLRSYLEDLINAKKEGRNLMTEKYARMMKYTFPDEYKQLVHRLPPVCYEAELLADRITALMVEWVKELKEKYPSVVGAGRPIESSGDSIHNTSIETYSRGELLTYGINTLKLCWEHFSGCEAQGINHYEGVLKNMVILYGYESIEQAEEDLRKKSNGINFDMI